jgi:hypothetical protein
MSVDTSGPAFPIKGPVMTSDEQGMTLRDYFAAKAGEKDIEPYWVVPLNREQAKYKYADAMLRARNA